MNAPIAAPNDTKIAGNIMQDMLKNVVRPDMSATAEALPAQKLPVQQVPSHPSQQIQVPHTQAPIQVTQAPRVEAPASEPEVTQPKEVETNFFTDDPSVEGETEAEPEVQQTEIEEEPDMSDVPETPAAQNFKKMREVLKEERKNAKKLAKQLAAVEAEKQEWAEGKKIPEILTAKDTEIQRLQAIEKQMNGRLSDEYQELVVKPSVETKNVFTKLAEDYQIPENIREALITKIVSTDNEKERNALITRYFPDVIGANKAKELVTEMHRLGGLALDMEKKPVETTQTLQQQYQARKQEERKKVASVLENVGKSAWAAAMEQTAQEGIYSNLVMDPANSEHNKMVERNQHRAAIQYGAVLKELRDNGLKTLPDKLAKGLARSITLAIGGVGAYRELQQVRQELAEIKQSLTVQTTYFRPGVNGNGFSQAAPKAPDVGPKSPQEAGKLASAALSNGLQKR